MPTWPPAWVSAHLHTCTPAYLPVSLSAYLPVSLPAHLPWTHRSTYSRKGGKGQPYTCSSFVRSSVGRSFIHSFNNMARIRHFLRMNLLSELRRCGNFSICFTIPILFNAIVERYIDRKGYGRAEQAFSFCGSNRLTDSSLIPDAPLTRLLRTARAGSNCHNNHERSI